ncbi:hypothetical protein P7C71_g844, partial [Lecanoromycetidae sp. Uapishka_2]
MWKQEAAVPWQKFKADVADYKKTEQYREYERYLVEFKASQAGKGAERRMSTSQQESPESPRKAIDYPSGSRGSPPRHPVYHQSAPSSGLQEKPRPTPSKVTMKRIKSDNEGWGGRDGTMQQPKRGGRTQEDNLLEKLKAYEALLLDFLPQVDEDDQQAIHNALLLPPQLELSKETRTRAAGSSSGDHDLADGESQASGIGSMGSTGCVHQDDFMPENREEQALAFAGPTSETKWIQRLKRELDEDNTAGKSKAAQQDPAGAGGLNQRPSGLFREDMDTAIVGHQIDPFQLPLKDTADALVNAYFSTVQISFPILDKTEFMHQYEDLFTAMDPVSYGDRIFLAILQLVFAISAVHAHLTEAGWAGDARDHMLSWNIIGLAVRSAQTLGLHLKNATPSITAAKKRHYSKVWFAVASLESMLTVMTGRPTMVNSRDCSVSLPRDLLAEGSPSETSSSEKFEEPQQDGVKDKRGSTSSSELKEGSEAWRDRLTAPFQSADVSPNPELEACRVSLRIAFHSTRTIINRPCLCRLDQWMPDQSATSKGTNREFAGKCIDSARAVLRLVLYKPDATVLQAGAAWWMTLHHLKRALTVSLLELAFRAEHMPANADEILVEAKDAVEWLRWHSASSPMARRTWVTMSRLLKLAAKKVGGDISDIIIAQVSGSDTSVDPPKQQQQAAGLQPMNPFEASDGVDEDDSDQFGFLREEGGMGSFFPTASEIEQMGREAGGGDMQVDGYD